jgi:hypothetical protein
MEVKKPMETNGSSDKGAGGCESKGEGRCSASAAQCRIKEGEEELRRAGTEIEKSESARAGPSVDE